MNNNNPALSKYKTKIKIKLIFHSLTLLVCYYLIIAHTILFSVTATTTKSMDKSQLLISLFTIACSFVVAGILGWKTNKKDLLTKELNGENKDLAEILILESRKEELLKQDKINKESSDLSEYKNKLRKDLTEKEHSK